MLKQRFDELFLNLLFIDIFILVRNLIEKKLEIRTKLMQFNFYS